MDFYDILHTHESGLKIIPASIYPGHLFRKAVTPYRLKSLLKDIYSVILIDSPPGLGKEVFFVLKACEEVIVVTNPDVPSVNDAMRVITAARELRKDPISIVVNRVNDKYELKAEEIEVICGAPVMGEIPEDKMVKKSLFEKTPVVRYSPNSPAAVAFKKIAAELLDINYRPPRFLKLRRIINK
jgi:septum site-determining protein MinD